MTKWSVALVMPLLAIAASPAHAQASRPAAPAAKSAASTAIPRATFLSQMDAEFRKMDTDKNGTLTKAEVDNFGKAAAAAEGAARNRAMFNLLDADKNGQISATEFAKLRTPAQAAGNATLLSRFDANRDQSVTLVEYRTGTLANFDRMDTDKDGVVSAAEMKAAGVTPR